MLKCIVPVVCQLSKHFIFLVSSLEQHFSFTKRAGSTIYFIETCLLIRTVSQVSDVANGPLVLLVMHVMLFKWSISKVSVSNVTKLTAIIFSSPEPTKFDR